MAPSNPTNPSSSPAPATPKLASALNALQISRESWPTFLDCSMISTSPSQATRNSSNTDSAVERLHLVKQAPTSTQPSQPTAVSLSHYAATGQQRILAVLTGSTLHTPPLLRRDLTISSTDSSSK